MILHEGPGPGPGPGPGTDVGVGTGVGVGVAAGKVQLLPPDKQTRPPGHRTVRGVQTLIEQ